MSFTGRNARACALVMAVGAAGCGEDATPPSSATHSGGTDSAPGEAQTVEIYSVMTASGDVEALQRLFDVHHKHHPNVQVLNSTVGTLDWSKDYLQRREAGTPPDVVIWVAEGLWGLTPLHALDDFLASASRASFVASTYPQLWRDVSLDGSVYALPWGVSRRNSFFYNQRVLTAHNLNPPKTVSELLDACRQLKANGLVAPITTSNSVLVLDNVIAGVIGIDAYNDFVKGVITDQTAFRHAVDVFTELVDGCFAPDVLAETAIASTSSPLDTFMSGTSPMLFDWDRTASALEQLGWTAGTDFGLTVAPGSAGLFSYSMWVLAIPADARHLEAAKDLLDSAASVEGQVQVNLTRCATPVRSDVNLSGFDSDARGVIDDLIQAKYRLSQKGSAYGWSKPISDFVKAVPHDKEALLRVILDLPAQPASPILLPSGEGGSACISTEDCQGNAFCDKKATPFECRPSPSGQGTACTSDADCAGFDANYCESFVSHTCLVRDCTPELNDCSDDYLCCSFSAFGLPSLCISRALNGDSCRSS